MEGKYLEVMLGYTKQEKIRILCDYVLPRSLVNIGCKDDDVKMDDEIAGYIIEKIDGPEIIESRLAGHWAIKKNVECKKIWLKVDEEIRAERVQMREGGELSQVLFSIKERAEKDDLRFKKYYQISLDDMTPYTLVIDCNTITPDEIAKKVIEHLKEV